MNRHLAAGPTLLRLADREGVDWHDHADHQLVYPGTGVLRVFTRRGSWVVPPLRAVWLPAGVAHAHRAHGRTDMHTLAFRPDDDPFGVPDPTIVAVTGLLREIVRALTDPELSPADSADLTAVLRRGLRPVTEPRLHLPRPVDDRLVAVTTALVRQPADTRTLHELARTAGASERTLSRLFRAETGMTFPQWRAQLRLHHSLTLLAMGEPVTAVAIACGYSNPSSFTAAFRDAFGVTPARYARGTRADGTAPDGTAADGAALDGAVGDGAVPARAEP
ncbi:AraC-type DNA-binding protein [Parafrankia irregularis]|uniref:HTH-type transcriptional regulator RipA n=1 Tax=Parafrankia irregularis TaxID=795642 RepID=A0A0S4QJ13_9ACTN|nr:MULTISPECIES: helix-turn-helix transcriptional regulator [Parafrankia]MBE3201065.1 helix-turn-helix transcriptional regulator [Parafrankia sp. CH37]CUU54534.1 AraC-type DNA-binding protein [Parafrankia irregularis]